MMAFKSHPSVRIKGTENNYEPILCEDHNCLLNVTPHLHCPFCPLSEIYQDPVILKAHFRVKHVDKGIDFAGLKVLRCCNTCDIVGSIKGTKEFKGAHWHCYRCKNGFNRRDEALKHYKTHFRNPQTTFQIQICQDVNQDLHASNLVESEQACEALRQENIVTMLHPTVQSSETSVLSSDGSNPGGGGGGGKEEMQVSVAANETVDSCSEHNTFMIIQTEADETDDTEQPSFVYEYGLTKKEEIDELKKTVTSQQQMLVNLKLQFQQLDKEKAQMEAQYEKQIADYKIQLENKEQELSVSEEKVEELEQQLNIPLTDNMKELMSSMKSQHENLLQQQLAQLKRTYTTSLQSSLSQQVFYITGDIGNSGEGESNLVSPELVTLGTDKFTAEEHLTGSSCSIKSEVGLGDSIVDPDGSSAAVFSQHFHGLVDLDISRKRKGEEEDEDKENPKKKQLT